VRGVVVYKVGDEFSEIANATRRFLQQEDQMRADQAGPLADAESRKAVVVQETEVAQLEASRTEQRLQAETVKPAEASRDARIAAAQADAREVELRAQANAERVKIEAAATAEQRRVLAEAEATATERTGTAEARATEAKGTVEGAAIKARLSAEAEGIEARAKALERNQQAVIQQALVEKLPETVRAAAEAYRGIDHMIVLNGAEGISGITGQVIGAGLATIPLLQELLTNGGDGEAGKRRTTDEAAASEAR
jgi:flotillin